MVPEYRILEPCAESEVSAIVRNMKYGCGDGSQTTSYACFCYSESAKYSRMISTRVSSACTETRGQETSALEVFGKYCQLGDIQQATTTTSPSPTPPTSTNSTSSAQSTSASPASTASSNTVSPTAVLSAQASEPPKSNDHTVAIATGITIPLVVVVLGLIGFAIYFHRRPKTKKLTPGELAAESHMAEVHGNAVYEKEASAPTFINNHDPVHEMNGMVEQQGELDGAPSTNLVDRKIERYVL